MGYPIVWLFLTVIGLTSTTVNADNVLSILPEERKQNLNSYIEYYEDTAGELSLNQIINTDLPFVRHQQGVLNAGFTQSTFWVKLTIRNPSSEPTTVHRLIELSYPLLDRIVLYRPNNQGAYTESTFGDSLRFSERELWYNNFVFFLDFQPQEAKTLYFKITTDSSMQVPLTLWKSDAFFEDKSKKLSINGIFYGIMLVMILYNLFIFISIKDISYLYYILYITSFGLFLSSVNAFSFQILWPNSPEWANVSTPIFIGISSIFALQFTREFLNTRKYAPRFNLVITAQMLFAALVIISSITMTYSVAIKLAIVEALLFTIIVFAVSLQCLLIGRRRARYFLLAWITMLLGVAVHVLTSAGVLPSMPLTIYASQIGCTTEVILLSLALADRINILRRENEKAQLVALESLERENKLKDEFLSTISHELNTPMNGIMGGLSLIKDYAGDKELLNFVSMVDDGALAMSSIVNKLLYMAELSSGKSHVVESAFSLVDLTSTLSEKYQPLCDEKGISFALEMKDTQQSTHFISDKDRILRLLDQLLENAVKFTNEGRITLKLSLVEDHSIQLSSGKPFRLSLIVRDTGVGMNTDHKKEFFTPFHQADGSFSRKYAGMGIGLSIVGKIVDLMSGNIDIVSDAGTEVIVNIPVTLV